MLPQSMFSQQNRNDSEKHDRVSVQLMPVQVALADVLKQAFSPKNERSIPCKEGEAGESERFSDTAQRSAGMMLAIRQPN